LFIFLYCYQLTWYLLVVVPMLPIPQHGLLRDLPSFVTICTPQSLAVKVTCMQDCCRRISRACKDLPFQLSIIFVHHLAARPENLGVIAWLLHCCCSLAFCAKDMFSSRPCHENPNFVPPLCPTAYLRVMHTCLHTYVHIQPVMSLQLITFGLVLLALCILIQISHKQLVTALVM
jgi:hypothetical protein